MSERRAETEGIQRLLKLEIDRAAERLIKVHGRQAFTHASSKVDVALKNSDDANHVYWMKIAEKVKRELPVRPF